jgi:hypothetical protein
MSDLEDSRTTAIWRKRKYEHTSTSTAKRDSDASRESGEISSEDSDVEEISAEQWKKGRAPKTSTGSDSTSDSDDNSTGELPRAQDGGMTRLQDISRDDRDAQAKYFHITASSELVRCLCCGARGHMVKECSTRTCSHCQRRDLHPSDACPTFRKCGLCRQRGHDAGTCRNPSFKGPDPCDVCLKTGHIEVSCQKFSRLLVCRSSVVVDARKSTEIG